MENKNYMKQVAEMLGVELDERFKINNTIYRIDKFGGVMFFSNVYKTWLPSNSSLNDLLTGKVSIVKIPKKDTKIFSVFPASGKTYAAKKLTEEGYKVLDLDSNNYSHWYKYENDFFIKEQEVQNPLFPQNYIKVIEEAIGEYDFIFISTHKEVRDFLENKNIKYSLVYPNHNMKEEWIGRCYLRGNNHGFCNKLVSNWDQWIKELDNVAYAYSHNGCNNKVFLSSSSDTRYLYDAIKKYYIKGE